MTSFQRPSRTRKAASTSWAAVNGVYFWGILLTGSILSRAYLRLSQYTANIVFRSNCITGEIMLAKLPQPVVNYLAAVTARDTEMFARCFTDDALVHDEGRDYIGLDAIT